MLVYGLETMYLNVRQLHQLETFQSSTIKRLLGLSKRSRSTNLLHALDVQLVEHVIKRQTVSLWNRIFKVSTSGSIVKAHRLWGAFTFGVEVIIYR